MTIRGVGLVALLGLGCGPPPPPPVVEPQLRDVELPARLEAGAVRDLETAGQLTARATLSFTDGKRAGLELGSGEGTEGKAAFELLDLDHHLGEELFALLRRIADVQEVDDCLVE